MFPSFPNFALFVFICQFQGFLFGAILVHARYRETTSVLNGSPQFGFGFGLCWGIARVCVKELFSIFLWENADPGEEQGGRGTAGAGPGRDLLYGSRGVPAPYRRTRDLGPHDPRPRTPRVQIIESVESTPDWLAQEERRCSERRALAGHGLDMEDLASMCERQCCKACNLRFAAEELEETGR